MFKNRAIVEENSSKKQNQSQISLQKLIKLDCRDSNFFYKDQFRNYYFKVHYPHTSTDVCPGQHLLKKFWNHIQFHYFKKPQIEELYRLQYLKAVFAEQIQNEKSFSNQRQFQTLINQTFNEQIANKILDSQARPLQYQNLYNRLYISWKKCKSKLSARDQKVIQKRLTESLEVLQQQKNKKKYTKSLKQEERALKNLMGSDILNGQEQWSDNQIQKEMIDLENQLSQIQKSNSLNLKFIQNKILQATGNNQIKSQNNSTIEQNRNNLKKTTKNSKSKAKTKGIDFRTALRSLPLELSLKQIEFSIKNLEQRQLSQSFSKILQCKKLNGQYYYLVALQSAMHVEPKLFSQQQFNKLNKLRETSLYQFYRTGVKSIYSYTSQSYAGFAQLCRNRQGLGKYKPHDVLQMMKKIPVHDSQVYESLSKFNTCHHCRFMYPEYLLKTCKFVSDRQVMPRSNNQATLDPDFSQIFAISSQFSQDKTRVSQRFTTRKKNSLTSYAKINQQYVCGRKYCISCLKDNYPNDIMNESISCPFCLGNCSCSRCIRNQKIVKFRSAYTILGGDFTVLSAQSCLQQLQNKEQSCTPRRRGRPKKPARKPAHIVIKKVQKKMHPILGQLKLGLSAGLGQRRITLANKKEYESFSIINKINKKRQILRQKSSTLLPIKRKRGRPPKNKCQSNKKVIRKTLKKLSRPKTD